MGDSELEQPSTQRLEQVYSTDPSPEIRKKTTSKFSMSSSEDASFPIRKRDPVVLTYNMGSKDANENEGGSLAENFLKRKKALLNRIHENEDSRSGVRKRGASADKKKEKTKEELINIRKQMMKPKFRHKSVTPAKQRDNQNEMSFNNRLDKDISNARELNSKLMTRLAKGTKTPVVFI
jgi:hypothetical protein